MKKKAQKVQYETEWLYHDDSHLARPKIEYTPTPEQEAEAERLMEEFWKEIYPTCLLSREEWNKKYGDLYPR